MLWSASRALAIAQRPRTYLSRPEAWGSLPHDLRCQAFYRTGRLPQALEEARLALEAEPGNPRLAENVVLLSNLIQAEKRG